MPLINFSGETYVAFSDLNGFKEMMRNHEKAAGALDKLYKTVYALKDNLRYSNVQTLAVSDCAISFVSNNGNGDQLPLILNFLKELHEEMIRANYLITSSVAHGQFSYHERIELSGLGKNMLYGDAYLQAYLNNNKCPEGSIVIICREEDKSSVARSAAAYSPFLRDARRGLKGLQFIWAVSSAADIENFEAAFADAYRLKYRGMISAYKEYLEEPGGVSS